MRACISNKCVQDDTILNLVYENHKNKFIFEHGFDPPLSRPRGKFVMNSEIQEDLSNPNPFELFNKWKNNSAQQCHNMNDPGSSLPWKTTESCCSCVRHSMPSYFVQNDVNSGFPDNKHRWVKFTLTALKNVKLTIAFELLHGLYYDEFDEYFGSFNKAHMHIHTPKRFSNSAQNCSSPRSTWVAVIKKHDFTLSTLNLPLNLPQKIVGQSRMFENSILLDRPSNIHGSDAAYNNENISLADSKRNRNQIKHSSLVSDKYEDVKYDHLWWDNADTMGSTGTNKTEFSFIALPYLSFRIWRYKPNTKPSIMFFSLLIGYVCNRYKDRFS